MYLDVEIGTRQEAVLQKVLLYYAQGGKFPGKSGFLTEHNVTADNPPQIKAGKLVTTSFLRDLMAGMEQSNALTFLPENVLAHKKDTVVWWVPGTRHSMFFGDNENTKSLDGHVFPHPALLFKVAKGGLYLRALAEDTRPTPETPLYVAPYWNTEPGSGHVCEGSMVRPRVTDVASLDVWERGFFASRFTHPSGMGVLTTHPEGFLGLWREVDACALFPTKYLQSTKTTLTHFLAER